MITIVNDAETYQAKNTIITAVEFRTFDALDKNAITVLY